MQIRLSLCLHLYWILVFKVLNRVVWLMKFATGVEALRDVSADTDIPHLCFILLSLAAVG